MSSLSPRGRLVRGLGSVVFTLGFLTLMGMNVASANGAVELMWVFGFATPACLIGGTLLKVHGRRLGAVDAHTVLRQDARDPILYLRAFDEDVAVSRRRTFWSWLSPLVAFKGTQEEGLAAVFSTLGPFVAIGRPGESLPELGAARMYVSDEEWQRTIDGLLARARLVVLVWAKTQGVRWEVSRVVGLQKPTRVLLVIRHGATAWAEFREWARRVLPVPPPEESPGTTVLTFDEQWNIKPLSPKREWSSTLAPFLRQNGFVEPAPRPSPFRASNVLLVLGAIAFGVSLFFAVAMVGNVVVRREPPAVTAVAPPPPEKPGLTGRGFEWTLIIDPASHRGSWVLIDNGLGTPQRLVFEGKYPLTVGSKLVRVWAQGERVSIERAFDGGVERVGIELGHDVIYNPGAAWSYRKGTAVFSVMPTLAPPAEALLPALVLRKPDLDYVLEELPQTVPLESSSEDPFPRKTVTYLKHIDAKPRECKTTAEHQLCSLDDGFLSLRKQGTSEASSTELIIDNTSSKALGVTIDGFFLGKVPYDGVWHVYLAPGEHVFDDGVTAPVTHTLGTTRSVWTAGGKRDYFEEHQDFGRPFIGSPTRKRLTVEAPVFETNVDLVFEPFPNGAVGLVDRLVRGKRR